MLIDGHSYNDIQAQLGGTISERTFWRYVSKIFAQDIKNLERATNEQMMRALSIHIERSNRIIQQLQSISQDTSINPDYRLKALGDMYEVSGNLVKTYANSPVVARDVRKKLAALEKGPVNDLYHQQQYSFPANEIFNPSIKNPYAEGNSILSPQEQEELRREDEQTAAATASQAEAEEVMKRPPTEAEFQEIRRQAAAKVDREHQALRDQGIDPDAAYRPKKRDWWV
jgi:hypothetical protein